MDCNIINGYEYGCRQAIGGIFEYYVGTFSGSTSWGVDVNGVITGATSAPTFYTYQQRTTQGSLDSTGNFGENGTVFYSQTAVIELEKMDSELRNSLLLLGASRMFVIAKDNMGVYHLVGQEFGGEVSAMTAGVGKAKGDTNGAQVTILADERELPTIISDAGFASLTIV
tara:strand:- start:322 stop:831 length:510 start_codon:yes stop_codon:yes gene_type:complete